MDRPLSLEAELALAALRGGMGAERLVGKRWDRAFGELRMAGLISIALSTKAGVVREEKPASSGGASRSARYRKRKRDAVTSQGVTERDAVTSQGVTERDAVTSQGVTERDAVTSQGVTERDAVTSRLAQTRSLSPSEFSLFSSPDSEPSETLSPGDQAERVTGVSERAREGASRVTRHAVTLGEALGEAPEGRRVELVSVLLRAYCAAYEGAFGSTWGGAAAARGHVTSVAIWCESQRDPASAAARVVDGAFASASMRAKRVPWKWIAEDPAQHADASTLPSATRPDAPVRPIPALPIPADADLPADAAF